MANPLSDERARKCQGRNPLIAHSTFAKDSGIRAGLRNGLFLAGAGPTRRRPTCGQDRCIREHSTREDHFRITRLNGQRFQFLEDRWQLVVCFGIPLSYFKQIWKFFAYLILLNR
jgi:hypothetical protein